MTIQVSSSFLAHPCTLVQWKYFDLLQSTPLQKVFCLVIGWKKWPCQKRDQTVILELEILPRITKSFSFSKTTITQPLLLLPRTILQNQGKTMVLQVLPLRASEDSQCDSMVYKEVSKNLCYVVSVYLPEFP